MWKLARTAWLPILLASGVLPAQRPPVEQAWDLLVKGDRSGAVQVLRRIIKANPQDAGARLMLGSILSEDGQLAESVEQLREAVRLQPRSKDAQYALGDVLYRSGDVNAARGHFEKAVALDAGFAPAHADLGMLLLEAGESAAAAKHLDRAIQLLGRSPDSAHSRYLRAKIYTEQNEIEKASAELEIAVALRPDSAEAWSDLGQARKSLRDDDGAFAAFKKSVDLNPDNGVSQYRLGAEYLRQDKLRLAIEHLELALRLNPNDQSTLHSLLLALRQDGQLERARQVKEKLAQVLLQIDKESQDAFAALRLNNEGAELEKTGNLKAAFEKYGAALKLDPEHIGIRVNFAVAALRLGQWSVGIAELREALRRDPSNAAVKAALDDALEQAPAAVGGKGKTRSGKDQPK
jgi:tetratricopeptide (TPR) repeat protein